MTIPAASDYFAEDNIIPEQVRLFEGQAIPDLAPYDFLFVLGGKQDTWEEDEYPWLRAEKDAIREWVMDRARPYFGVCLGHQLLCTALGGEVAPAEQKEVGVHEVTLTEDGQSHRLFEGLGNTHKVMQWHMAEVKRPPQQARRAGVIVGHGCADTGDRRARHRHAVPLRVHAAIGPRLVVHAELHRESGVHKGEGAYPRLVAGLPSRSCRRWRR